MDEWYSVCVGLGLCVPPLPMPIIISVTKIQLQSPQKNMPTLMLHQKCKHIEMLKQASKFAIKSCVV